MATPRLARPPTCLNCLRRLVQPAFPSPLFWTQTRAKTTRAELEDLQGLPVRLLRDIPTFGRKHAIIRVKGGRMRNIWFPKGAAEYMTRQRFVELGLTEASIGVRDRTFGTNLVVADEEQEPKKPTEGKAKRIEVLPLSPKETTALLETLLPEVLVFTRVPVPTAPPPPPQPAVPRSPSLAANAATSTHVSEAPESSHVTPIFGSVSRNDILAMVKEKLLGDPQGSRAALDVDSLEIVGLDPEHDGDNRIKRLGDFTVLIAPGFDARGNYIEPVRRAVQVVPGNA